MSGVSWRCYSLAVQQWVRILPSSSLYTQKPAVLTTEPSEFLSCPSGAWQDQLTPLFQMLAGPNAIAGEWGHNPLPWPQDSERPGPACYCGKHGCIETFLSGPGLSADHYRHTGEQLTTTTISQQSHSGPAADTLARYEDRLARSLASIINVIDPDTIVLGGGVSNISRLYDNVPRLWGQYVFSDVVSTRLVRAEHGDSSGVRGAAWL